MKSNLLKLLFFSLTVQTWAQFMAGNNNKGTMSSTTASKAASNSCQLQLTIPQSFIASTCPQSNSANIDQKIAEIKNYCSSACSIGTKGGNVQDPLITDQLTELRKQVEMYQKKVDTLERLVSAKGAECNDVLIDGSYNLLLGNNMKNVYCQDKWIVIQRRFDGSENFYRGWNEYKMGFGNASGEYWLGNEVLHQMTSNHNYSLKVTFKDRHDKWFSAEYSNFKIGNESNNYRLQVSGFTGNATDALNHPDARFLHSGMDFSTYDRDNDKATKANCAAFYTGAWWYNNCFAVHLNGRYCKVNSPTPDDKTCSVWWARERHIIADVTMMIKRII